VQVVAAAAEAALAIVYESMGEVVGGSNPSAPANTSITERARAFLSIRDPSGPEKLNFRHSSTCLEP